MARRFEDLSKEEKERICQKIQLQNILEDEADLEYQAYYLHTTAYELKDKLLDSIQI